MDGLVCLLCFIDKVDLLGWTGGDGPFRLVFDEGFTHLAELRILAMRGYAGRRDLLRLALMKNGLALTVRHVSIDRKDGRFLKHVFDGYFMRMRLLGMLGLVLIGSGRGTAPKDIQD